MFSRRGKGYSYDNTRRFVRLPASWPVKYQPELDAGAPAQQVAHTGDVSAGGIALNVREMLPVGTRIHLEVHVPPLGRSLRAIGQVMRCSPARGGGFEIGVQFDQIDKTDQVILDEAISRFYSPRQKNRYRSGTWWRNLP